MMRFIKLMLMLVAGFFVVSVVRMVMDGFKKGLTSDARVPTSREASTPDVTPGADLKKCAACGVYNAAANSVTKVRGGVTVYYCSAECRAKAAA
jgi:hypothetical protein